MMTATLIAPHHAPTGTSPNRAPKKPDGSAYAYRVVLPVFRTYTDSLASLMPILLGDPVALVPDYATVSPDQQLVYRLRIAIQAQIRLQAQINAQWFADPTVAVTAEERTILTQDRAWAVEVEHWASPIPLVLIWTDYVPFSTIFRPTGDALQWINPLTEETLVRSLDALGYVALDGVA